MGALPAKGSEHRETEYEVAPVILDRWSPRAMSGESLDKAELMSLFEAAKWAPSSYNAQPWRFVYATRDSESWQSFLDLLVPPNQEWAKDAAALVVVTSRETFERNGKPAITHSYDTGAAGENLAIQGSLNGLVVHSMEGFDYDAAREVVGLPDGFSVEAMIAIGKPADLSTLPEPVQEREAPSGRKALSEIVFEGRFPESS